MYIPTYLWNIYVASYSDTLYTGIDIYAQGLQNSVLKNKTIASTATYTTNYTCIANAWMVKSKLYLTALLDLYQKDSCLL